MTESHRGIEQIIEEQVRKWELMSKEKKKQRVEPVIAISRTTGSLGEIIAKEVAGELGFDLMGREILQKIAENAHLSEAVLATLDEKGRTLLQDWLRSGLTKRAVWSDRFLPHLANVVGTAAKHGRAVLLGRGASFLLSPTEGLRVLVVAPLELRIERVAKEEKLAEPEARQRVKQIDAERRAYIRKYFDAEFTDPVHYDLVINTEGTSIPVAVSLIKSDWESKRSSA
jgi:hypothetical protein